MRVKALAIRIIKQTINDKRTLALMMFAPLIVMSLVYFLFNSSKDVKLNIGVYNTNSEFNDNLKETDLNILNYSNKDNIKDDLSAFIYLDDNTLNVTYENSSPQNSKQIEAKINATLAKDEMINIKNSLSSYQKQFAFAKNTPNLSANLGISKVSVKNNYIYGDKNLSYFDTLNPILIGFFVFFFVFLVSGISLLKERTSGTLDKLLSTPIKRSEIIRGYLLGYGLFSVIQTIILVLFSVYILNIKIVGSVFLVIIINILIAFVALTLGVLMSTFANSEFQMMQFVPIIIVPQIFFTGIIPVESMANWLQVLSRFTPLYYGSNALSGVVLKGYTFNDIYMDIIILLLFAIILSLLNIVGLKRYRKI
ncbi:ABC transporter permease [Romboutsia hominis]|uniref:ABC transporter, permease protein n=1 Tax=Romboutsia hominis TaxID=1507512 RepID=A0A2P2BTY4_9FIRM|nr:ABC transporter permease [Romboutsia hominis]CEI72444.1 ABC transporter, permease protein [Romboutsia hominis]